MAKSISAAARDWQVLSEAKTFALDVLMPFILNFGLPLVVRETVRRSPSWPKDYDDNCIRIVWFALHLDHLRDMACNLRKTKLGNSRPAKRALEQIASYSAQIAADCHDVSRLDQAIEDLRERLDAQTLDKPLDAYCRARVAGRAPPSLPRPLSRRYRQDVADLAANTERGHLYRCLHLRRPTDLRTFIAHPLAAAFRECFGVEPGCGINTPFTRFCMWFFERIGVKCSKDAVVEAMSKRGDRPVAPPSIEPMRGAIGEATISDMPLEPRAGRRARQPLDQIANQCGVLARQGFEVDGLNREIGRLRSSIEAVRTPRPASRAKKPRASMILRR